MKVWNYGVINHLNYSSINLTNSSFKMIYLTARYAKGHFLFVILSSLFNATVEILTYIWIITLSIKLKIIHIDLLFFDDIINDLNIVKTSIIIIILRFIIPALQQYCLSIFYVKFTNQFSKAFAFSNILQSEKVDVQFVSLMTTKIKPMINSFFLGFVNALNCFIILLMYVILLLHTNTINIQAVLYIGGGLLIILLPLAFIVTKLSSMIREAMDQQAVFVNDFWKSIKRVVLLKKANTYFDRHFDNERNIRNPEQIYQYLAQLFKIVVDGSVVLLLIIIIQADLQLNNDNILLGIITLQRIMPFVTQFQNAMLIHRSALGIAKEYANIRVSMDDVDAYFAANNGSSFNKIYVNNVIFNISDKDICIRNFELFAGDKIVIVGRSGTGKSTFVKSLFGQYPVRAAEVSINGSAATMPFLGEFKSFYLDQNITTPSGTVWDNCIEYYPATGIEKFKLLELMKAVELPSTEEFLLRNVAALSGGQRQRLLIVLAIISNAEIIIFDEFTSALDPVSVDTIIHLVNSRLFADRTVLIISHDMRIIETADKVFNLEENVYEA